MKFLQLFSRVLFILVVIALSMGAMIACATPEVSNGNINETTTESEPPAVYVHNDIFTLSKVAGTHSVDPEKRIEVRVIVVNLDEAFNGSELSAVGFWLHGGSAEFNWDNNPGSPNLNDTVVNGSAEFVFYFDTANDTTDFKIFEKGTWNEVITDPQEGDGNIRIVFPEDFASAGEIVQVSIDAASFGAED